MNENPCSNNEHRVTLKKMDSSMIALKQCQLKSCEKSNGEVQFSLLRVWLRCGVVPIVIAHTLLVLLIEDNFATAKFLMLIITETRGCVIYIKSILRQKKNDGNSNSSPCKNTPNLRKRIPLKGTKILQDIITL